VVGSRLPSSYPRQLHYPFALFVAEVTLYRSRIFCSSYRPVEQGHERYLERRASPVVTPSSPGVNPEKHWPSLALPRDTKPFLEWGYCCPTTVYSSALLFGSFSFLFLALFFLPCIFLPPPLPSPSPPSNGLEECLGKCLRLANPLLEMIPGFFSFLGRDKVR